MSDGGRTITSPYSFSLSDAAREKPPAFESELARLAARVAAAHPDVGATVTFEGRVRNHHKGRSVERLSYSAYERLAENEAHAILGEAMSKFELTFAHVIHRTGELQVGDIAVWIFAGSAHRSAAFDGCRYVIEEIKQRLPVWKHEFYDDGTSMWVNGAG